MAGEALRILLAADGSPHARAAERILAGLRWPPGSSATVLGVVRQNGSLLGLGLAGPAEVKDTRARLRRVAVGAAQTLARRAAGELSEAGLAAAAGVLEGEPGDAVVALAAELRAGLIALGARGFSQLPASRLGSTAWHVLRQAPSSVLIARPGSHARPARFIVAADGLTDRLPLDAWPFTLLPAGAEVTIAKLAMGSDDSGASLQPGRGSATAADDEEQDMLAVNFGEALQARGLTARNVFPLDEPREELVRLAHCLEADLVIVAAGAVAGGNWGVQQQLAEAVAQCAPCSVLLVRPEPCQAAAPPAGSGRIRLPARLPAEMPLAR